MTSLYSQMLQYMINRSLDAEMEAHLGYGRNDKAELGVKRTNTRKAREPQGRAE